jgi:aminoglycoside phosphotransferase (APT) family kinase protein
LTKIHKTKDPTIIEKEFQKLKDNFPKPEPYVLTHRDLTLGNIMIKDDKITAIIDWEYAGYYPWWAERWLTEYMPQDDSDELMNPIWPRLEPFMDLDKFMEEVYSRIKPVVRAWEACIKTHPNYYYI